MKALKQMFNKFELFIKHKLQKRANNRFFKKAIPVKSTCLLIDNKDEYIVTIMVGYLFDQELGTVIGAILGIPDMADLSKRFSSLGNDYKIRDWSLGSDRVWEMCSHAYTIRDSDLYIIEDISRYHNGYLLINISKLFDDSLKLLKKTQIKVKVPTISDE